MDYINAFMTVLAFLYSCDEAELIMKVFKLFSCISFAIILLSIYVFMFTTDIIY